ncbi:MAG: NUDIX hydrolase [Crocinitomicaceae bacterium]
MQIYKVFIDNRPVFFEINPSSTEEFLTVDEIKKGLDNFIDSDYTELYIEIESENTFHSVFEDYKFVEAAGGLVQLKQNYLFIKRDGLWDIPKGKLEKGETPEEAAVREIMEECGIESPPTINKHLIDTWHVYERKSKLHLKKTYWYLLTSADHNTNFTPQAEEDITEVKYFPKKAFDTIKKNTYNSIKDVLKSLNK